MTSWRRSATALVCACAFMAGTRAAENTALDDYLAGMSTWTANFTQSVVDANGRSVAGGSGRLLIVRPGKFRWEYTPRDASDAAQLMIADGRNLWFTDYELEQTTVKPQAEALSQSPAMLLAGGAELRSDFTVREDGRRDGLQWVRVEPRAAASEFREVQFGFKGKELARLVIVDKLGQRSTLSFRDVKRNVAVDPALMKFVLPPGAEADLIGRPVDP
jgi:outer membrane lipoprotein carrier protein